MPYHSRPVLERCAPSLYLLLLLQKLAWPRWREVATQKIWPVPEAVFTVLCTPDERCGWHPKHVEWTCRIINRLLCVASCWTIINNKKAFQRFPLRLHRCQLGRSGKHSARIYCTEIVIHVCHPRECTFPYSSNALLHINSNLLFFYFFLLIWCSNLMAQKRTESLWLRTSKTFWQIFKIAA